MIAPSNNIHRRFAPVVVAPTYHNAGTLLELLNQLNPLALPIIVVNDGSTDETAFILESWQRLSPANRQVLTHPCNRGKGAALRTAFAHATAAGFTHAVTIDTDGQLSPQDIPALLNRAKQQPGALVVGVRDKNSADYPAFSRIGRTVSNFLIWVESGIHISDSQCGLRVYPLQLVSSLKCRSEFFGFETEIITRAGWAGQPTAGEPVICRYLPPHQRVSHFKPLRDSARAVRMHLWLIAGAMNPFAKPFITAESKSMARPTVWRRFSRWINPLTAWRQIRHDTAARTRFAAGFALGVFIANLPVYGIQTFLSLFVARRLKLHPLSVVAGSNLSMPPIGPLLIAGGIAAGHFMLHGSLPALADYKLNQPVAVIGPLLCEWLIGGIVLGALLAGITFVCLEGILRATAAAGGWAKTPEPSE